MQYKGWNLRLDSMHVREYGIREFTIIASHHRVILTPELEHPVPYLGRMTRQEVLPMKLESRGTNLRKMLTEIKGWIDEIGPFPWIVYNDPWAKN